MKNFIIFPSICDGSSFDKINDIRFTQREIDVVACTVSGREAKSIAQLLGISPSTVKVHLQNIKLKFGGNFKRDILDFVEHSAQFSQIKAHYSHLLFSSIFGDYLKKIKQSSLKNVLLPVVFHVSEIDLPFAKQLIEHIKMAGVDSSIAQKNDSYQGKRHRIYVIRQEQNTTYLSKDDILLSVDTGRNTSLLKDQKDYCVAVLRLLEIILSTSLEREILSIQEKLSKIYLSDSPSPTPKSKKKNSSFKGLIISLIFTVLSFFLFTAHLHREKERHRHSLLLSHVHHIEKRLQFIFGYVSHITANIGQKIASTNYLNLKEILAALREEPITDTYLREQFSWSFFDWIDVNDKILASSHGEGILKEPRTNMTRRNYVRKGKETPWKLYFDLPDVGISSGLYIIPSGMGVTNKHGEYIGTVSASFNVEELTNKINTSINHRKIKFILIDCDNNIILNSPGKEKMMKRLLEKTHIQKDLKIDASHFNHEGHGFISIYKSIKGYPYKIVLFYKKNSLFKELISLTSVELVILFLTFLSILTYLTYSLIISIQAERNNNRSDVLRDD